MGMTYYSLGAVKRALTLDIVGWLLQGRSGPGTLSAHEDAPGQCRL
jgi:hypothetical protein